MCISTAMLDMIPAWVDGTLEPVEKLEVHRRGLRHKAVSVFLVSGGEILIQKRAAGKYHTPNLWANSCCTHPLWDESAENCATRRLAQELGITGVTPVWRDRIEYRADVGAGLTEHEVVDLFRVDTDARPDLAPNPAEVSEIQWISLSALDGAVRDRPEDFTPWLKIYLADHKASVFGPA